MEGTIWAFLPAVIAIVLALVTKQVYISLFFGIFVGAMMYAGGDPLKALFTLYQVMSEKVGGNVSIIVFLVVLGILVILMQKSGGAKAYGDWAGKKISSKSGVLAATAKESLWHGIFPGKMVNTTGCGDAFMGALVWAYLEGMNLEDTAAAGLAAGSIAMESDETINPILCEEILKKRMKQK